MSDTRRRPGELVFTALLLLGSAFLLWQAYGISKFESITSAGVFPMFAALVMLVSALLVMRTTATAAPAAQEGESLPRQFFARITPPVVLGFTAAIAVYMALLEPLGFVLSSYGFLVGAMRLLGSRRWLVTLLVSTVSLALIVVVFQTVFSVVLPKGTLLQGWLS